MLSGRFFFERVAVEGVVMVCDRWFGGLEILLLLDWKLRRLGIDSYVGRRVKYFCKGGGAVNSVVVGDRVNIGWIGVRIGRSMILVVMDISAY